MSENFDFEIVEIAGREVLARVLEMRERLPASRRYPFIIGAENSLEMIGELYEFNENSAAEIVEAAMLIEPEELFARRKNDALPAPEEEPEFDRAKLTGEWERRDSVREIGLGWDDFVMAHRDILSSEFFDRCLVGVAPTGEAWRVPAYARWGGFNECPKPAEHCAAHRYWQAKYGAEITSLTGDVTECLVKNPPQTEEECWQLAWQQFAYCPDIVDQGVGTVGALASGLRDSPYWYFWWD